MRLRLKKKMKKNRNDEKIKRVGARKILKYCIIFFGLLTLVLAIHSLITKSTPIFAVISFSIEAILSYCRKKLDPKLLNSDSKSQE